MPDKEQTEAVKELIDLAREFVARVERGEVRSVYTYNRFKSVLARLDTGEKE